MKITDEKGRNRQINEGEICFVNIIAKNTAGKILKAEGIVFSRDYNSEVLNELSTEDSKKRRLLKKFSNGKETKLQIMEIQLIKKIGRKMKTNG